MSTKALGLIETRGLVGVLEAADTAAKAADVQLEGIERIGGGFVSLRLSGEVAAVQAAVRAGSAAAGQVSELIGAHVIPAPQLSTDSLAARALPDSPAPPVTAAPDVTPDTVDAADLDELSVTRLRQLARRTPGVSLQGRQVSRANREQLLAELRRALGEREG